MVRSWRGTTRFGLLAEGPLATCPRWPAADDGQRGLRGGGIALACDAYGPGGGAVAAAGLDQNNDYNVVSNGGAYADPTYVTPGS